MFNLILKDILLQKHALLVMLPALLIYLFFGTSSIWVGIVFCIAFIMSVFANDEKSPANLLMNALPYTRKEIVSSKYIGAFVITFIVLFTIFIGNMILHQELIEWKPLLFVFSIVMVFVAFAFPFSYLFTSQYLMIGSGVLFVVYLIIVNTFIHDLNDKIRDLTKTILSFTNTQLYLFILLPIIFLYIFSWILSIRIYHHKVI